ncbi:hypothetical protein TRVL_06275 [Trypanosoma vivax]|nr:hypothetical protein TRVL_06275 [Trypanosoma vivax]
MEGGAGEHQEKMRPEDHGRGAAERGRFERRNVLRAKKKECTRIEERRETQQGERGGQAKHGEEKTTHVSGKIGSDETWLWGIWKKQLCNESARSTRSAWKQGTVFGLGALLRGRRSVWSRKTEVTVLRERCFCAPEGCWSACRGREGTFGGGGPLRRGDAWTPGEADVGVKAVWCDNVRKGRGKSV